VVGQGGHAGDGEGHQGHEEDGLSYGRLHGCRLEGDGFGSVLG
jgi:hypothetical protein